MSMKLNHANKGLNVASTIYFNEAVSLQAPCSYILETRNFGVVSGMRKQTETLICN